MDVKMTTTTTRTNFQAAIKATQQNAVCKTATTDTMHCLNCETIIQNFQHV